MKTDDPYMTVEQVAEFFQVTPYTVRDWLKNNILSGTKLNGRLWRVRKSEVVRFANEKYGEAS